MASEPPERGVRRKRVVIAQEYVPAYREPLFALMKEILAARDVDLLIAAGRPGKAARARQDAVEAAVDIHVPQWEARPLGRRLTVRDTRAIRRSADLLVLEQARRNLDAFPSLVRGATAMWGHGTDATSASGRLSRRFLRALTRRARWFFAYTPAGARAAIAAGVPADQVTVVYNATDTRLLREERESLAAPDAAHVRDELNLTELTAIFVGALEAPKRIGFLVEAAREAHRLNDSFRLLVVGDGSERARVEDDSSGAIVYVERATGAQLARLASAASILAMPGRVGLVAVDALALGLPVVTTDWPWHAPEREYLDDATCLVARNSPAGFARDLLSLLEDADRLEAMSLACLESSRNLTIEAMATRFADGIVTALESIERDGPRPRRNARAAPISAPGSATPRGTS